MTVEELLKPRYKVIADYPGSEFEVDDIIYPNTEKSPYTIVYYDQYPHLFKRLEWWEERSIDDMRSM